MLTQVIESLIRNCSVRKHMCRSALLPLLLCTQFSQPANAQALSDKPQLVAAAWPQPHAEVSDRVRFGGPQNAGTGSAQEITRLESGSAVERELAGDWKHIYEMTLAQGQYAIVTVEQRGIDVVVQLIGTDGKSIADFDNEVRIQGEEKIELVAETAGTYRLLIKAKYPRLPAGRYEIRWIEQREATEEDRALYRARRQETASRQLWGAGKYAEALPLGEEALKLQERVRGAEHPDLAYPLLNLAAIYFYRGDYSKAEALCERALAIAEKTLGPEHQLVARLLNNLASFYRTDGDNARAEPLYRRAITIREKGLGPGHPLVAALLSELAVVYRSKGDFVRAEPLLQRALMVQEETLGEEHNNVASALNSLGNLYWEKGDYAKAEPLYLRSLAIREKANHPSLAAVLHNLAEVYRGMGDYDRAEQLYLRSVSIKEKSVGPNHPDVADTRGNIAFLYYQRGDNAKAETLFLNAVATLEKALGPKHPLLGLHLNSLANIYFATGDYAKAEPLSQRALSIFETANGPDYYYLADILVNLAAMSAAEGKLAQAIAYQARANAIIEHNLVLNLAVGSERQKLAYLARLPKQMNQAVSLHVRLAVDDAAARELAATTILQRKGRVQDALSNSLASLHSRSTPADQALLDQLNDTTSQLARLVLNGPQSASLAEDQKRVKTLADARERLESVINSSSAEFRAQKQPVTLGDVRRVIPEGAALVEFAIYQPLKAKALTGQTTPGEPHYVVYVIRSQGEVRWTELGPAREIDTAVAALRLALGNPRSKNVQRPARALDEKVMRPVRALVGDATELLISPDGALNLIPFEALVDEQDRYLVQSYAFTYLTSGRDLLRMQVPRASSGRPTVVANPSFGERAPEQIARVNATSKPAAANLRRRSVTAARDLSEVYFAPLSGTAREADTIHSLFREAELLTGAGATESALKAVAAPRLLHIATHGFFLEDTGAVSDGVPGTRRETRTIPRIENPLLRSGLALAGANLRGDGPGDDGILTALEASGLNLWGTKLVVLSACDTGLGEVKNGEGVYGLRRAFVLAGAESLVMSLWPVSDYSTRTLMSSYYKNLKLGLGRGPALRQVQLDLLKGNKQLHPFYWANFIQSGEWANLEGRRQPPAAQSTKSR